ncbi:MAG: hypothetical protein CMJ83_04795 [Planctomycetes bacterium]|nr:hypothetical protein [Planctomycetota bacterium]
MKITWWVGALALATFSVAQSQYSLSFDGPARSIRVEKPGLELEGQSLTVELRIKLLGRPRARGSLVSRGVAASGAQDGSFELALLPSSKISFRIRDRDERIASVTSRAIPQDGNWHHILASWTGTTVVVYLDGAESNREEIADFGLLSSTGPSLVIGPSPLKKGRVAPALPAILDDIAVWSRALGAAETQRRAKETFQGDESGLVLGFSLRAATPTSTVENSVSGGPRGRLSPRLARSGWCSTTAGKNSSLVVHCHDLSAAPGAAEIKRGSRSILVEHSKEKRIGVLWQDGTDRSVWVSWVDPVLGSQETRRLQAPANARLVAGTSDSKGNLYYLVVQGLEHGRPESEEVTASIHKAKATGEPLLARSLDTGRQAFNIWSYNPSDRGNMRFSKGVLGVILPRRMHRARDGLKHQGAIAVTFAAKTLKVIGMLGQTSGHSKGSFLTVNAKGSFLGMDLGDNYPRGLHLHEFAKGRRTSKVIFTYKTAHGRRPYGGSPVYPDISGNGTTFYQWSNDNDTYTDLGGIVEGRRSYQVVFSTDRTPEGKVLDNRRAHRNCDDPHDLALLRIVKNFRRGSGRNEVPDAIIAGLAKNNRPETGGFFNFRGQWVSQRVTGVRWLTNYGKGEAARAPQIIALKDKRLLLLWEKLTSRDRRLQAMRIDEKGRVIEASMQLHLDIRLNREDRLIRLQDRVFFLASDPKDGRTRLYALRDA